MWSSLKISGLCTNSNSGRSYFLKILNWTVSRYPASPKGGASTSLRENYFGQIAIASPQGGALTSLRVPTLWSHYSCEPEGRCVNELASHSFDTSSLVLPTSILVLPTSLPALFGRCISSWAINIIRPHSLQLSASTFNMTYLPTRFLPCITFFTYISQCNFTRKWYVGFVFEKLGPTLESWWWSLARRWSCRGSQSDVQPGRVPYQSTELFWVRVLMDLHLITGFYKSMSRLQVSLKDHQLL